MDIIACSGFLDLFAVSSCFFVRSPLMMFTMLSKASHLMHVIGILCTYFLALKNYLKKNSWSQKEWDKNFINGFITRREVSPVTRVNICALHLYHIHERVKRPRCHLSHITKINAKQRYLGGFSPANSKTSIIFKRVITRVLWSCKPNSFPRVTSSA